MYASRGVRAVVPVEKILDELRGGLLVQWLFPVQRRVSCPILSCYAGQDGPPVAAAGPETGVIFAARNKMQESKC